MKTQHTPGPWESMGFYISARNRELPLPNSQTIARVFPEHETVGGNTLANAHLISAAPELLLIARDYVLFCELHELEGATLDAARAAIAKAEGRAE